MNRFLKAKIIENYGSQWEFAKAIKVHESDVSRVVRGKKELDQDTQKRWARALKSDPEYLFSGK